MGASLGTGGGPVADINMTPLIDIVLVVLIIMMVNMPVQIEQMGVKLPSPNVDPKPIDNPDIVDQLVVALYENGDVALNKMRVDDERLFSEITRRLRPMEKKKVFIDAHADVKYEVVINMVDLVREAGAEAVGFAKIKEAGPAAWVEVLRGSLPRGIYPGSPGVVGAITEKKADEQFQPMLPAIESCYAASFSANPDLRGRAVFLVDVGPEGQVMDTDLVTSTMDDEALHTCILEKLPGLKYEALGPENTARIHYPIVFSAGPKPGEAVIPTGGDEAEAPPE